jgi:hypothetical protein
MKVPDGMTIHKGGRRYGAGEEIPDDLLPTVKTEPVAAGPKKRAADEPARKG